MREVAVSAGLDHVSDPAALDVLLRARRWGNWTLAVAPAHRNLTYLQQAVVDALVCENATSFGGTPYSTFSNWVFNHLVQATAPVYQY